MTPILRLRLLVSLAGFAVWGVGIRTDRRSIQIAGLVIMGVAVLLRFLPARRGRNPDRGVSDTTDAPPGDDPR